MKTSNGFSANISIQYGDTPSSGRPLRYVDTAQSIQKPLHYCQYGTVLPTDAVKLAYAYTDDIDSQENVTIVDRSRSMAENCPDPMTLPETTVLSRYIESKYKDILITDVFTTTYASRPAEPLYYFHELPADVDPDNVSILDTNFNEIDPYSYEAVAIPEHDIDGELTGDTEYVALYNNLSNSFDPLTGELVAYYARYTTAGDTGDQKTATVLLANEAVYHEATFDDVNMSTMKLKTWAKAYLIQRLGDKYRFTLPRATTYSVKSAEGSRIMVEPMQQREKTEAWTLRVHNGDFTVNMNGENYRYYIPEFDDQGFNPVQPYKFVANEVVEKVDYSLANAGRGLVYLERTPLAVQDDMPLSIIIKDQYGQLLHALTTDDDLTDTYYEDTTTKWQTDKILSTDPLSGLVHIDVPIKDYYQLTSSYYYEEEAYELREVNLNPLLNNDATGGFYVIYVVPEATVNGNVGTLGSSIQYLKVDENGIITAFSQDGGNGALPDLTGIIVPGTTRYGRDGLGGSEGSFIHEFSIESSGGSEGLTKGYLVLAEVSIGNRISPADVVILDCRKPGGGVKEASVSTALDLNPQVNWFTDIGLGGGIRYPGEASVVVQLPHTILTKYGGSLEESEVLAIVKRHMAFGTYPIIRYYSVVPNIYIDETSIATSGQITVYWSAETSDYTFMVYHAADGDSSYTASTTISNNPAGNSYTISSLTPNRIYKIYAVATTGGVNGLKSKELRVMVA